MKVYIAGKITGDPGYHYHFHKAEAELYKRGGPKTESTGGASAANAGRKKLCLRPIFSAEKRAPAVAHGMRKAGNGESQRRQIGLVCAVQSAGG